MKKCIRFNDIYGPMACLYNCPPGICKRGRYGRYRPSFSGGPTFLPSSISGLVAWYRFGVGITEAGSGVSNWADQSGAGNDLVQGTDANRPAKQSDGSILFDGVDNFLKTASFTLAQPVSVCLLMKQVTWTLNDSLFDGNAGNDLRMYQDPTTPSIHMFAGSSGPENTGLTVDTYMNVFAIYNGASSYSQVNDTISIVADAGSASPDGFTLGSFGNGGAGWGNIQVKEIALYNVAITASNISDLRTYFATL